MKTEIKQNIRKNRYYREECKCEFCLDGEKNELIQRLITNSYAIIKDNGGLIDNIKNKVKNETKDIVKKDKLKEFLSKNPKEIQKQHEKFKQSYD